MSESGQFSADLSGSLEQDAAPDEGGVRRTLGWAFWLCVGWLVTIVLAALLAPWLPLKDPDANLVNPDFGRPPYSPSTTHWFGTDQDARDVFSRTIFGARVSLVVGFVAIAFGMVIGGTLGTLAGYFRGWWDRVVSFVFVVLLSFPALVLAILITSLLDRGLVTISLTLGFLAIAPVGRLARATTIQYAEREFVIASRTLGASHSRIIVRELLPNVVIPMGALALLGMAVAIVAEGGLAFLGLSVEKEETWGNLILLGSGSRDLENAPWISLSPIFILFLTVLALNYAGDKLRAYFDVREISL
ncbi:MAG: ABC transporter permease [Ilumatobacter sp.]|uniref:ABC transporter permease n=1 Tax=Ilumatobacter sp. TaxID=1967498 RepID=UPI002621D4C9|nr:ABC transporter permease [Ilumatobacter sp.]MDJ0767305.1 ABC transporter permease [Ilumatobacter sp.]